MNSHTERAHAKLSASGSHRWLACPGSVIVEEGIPYTTSEFAEYGTAGHELAELCLSLGQPASKYTGTTFNQSKNYPEGFVADNEMCDAVQTYIDYCNDLPGDDLFIEQRVDFSPWVADGFGTADYIKIGKNNSGIPNSTYHIHCVDLKMGKGVKVYAERNSQGMLYALGVLNDLGMAYEFTENDRVTVSIVQPRLDHIDEWTTTVGELWDWAYQVVKPMAEKCIEGAPEFNPGEKQCKFCKAQSTCKALAKHSLNVVVGDFDDIPDKLDTRDVHLLNNEELGRLLEHVNTIVNWAKSLEATALSKLELGEKVPGYKMVKGRAGNRKWKSQEEVEQFMHDQEIECPEMYQPVKLLTPPNMVKLFKTNSINVDDLENLWIQPEGKPTIAIESDKREEIVPADTSGFDEIN